MIDFSINFHDLNNERNKFNYVVIVTQYKEKWVWVRQHNKLSWEIPGGHVDGDETPEMAAKRELWEETGALKYTLTAICDFSINNNGKQSYNRLFYCEIEQLGDLPESEIEEISFLSTTPKLLTHGKIQPILIDKVREIRNTTT